jgi:branched-chain amino acid transport system permease protein
LTYRASGVVNFAHAAMGMYLAFAYYQFRATGDLILPVLGLPSKFHLVNNPTVFTSLIVITVLAAVLGAGLYLLIFRKLRTAPALARVIASVGLLIYLMAIVDLRFPSRGAATGVIVGPLPDDILRWGEIINTSDRLIVAGLVLVVALLLKLLYQFTRFGVATRAAAENERGALLLGISPHVIGAVNWALATVLAGLAVILVATRIPFEPVGTSLLIVPALAAALVGGFRSFGLTAIAGLAIGAAQSEIFNLRSEWSWLPDIGLEQGIPFVLIIVLMVVRGDSILGRGQVRGRGLPRAPEIHHSVLTASVLTTVGVIAMMTVGSDWRLGIIMTSIGTVMALSVVLVTGFVGQISMAQYTFAGVAAFTMVRLTESLNVPFPLTPILAALVAMLVSIGVGFPAVRVRGMNLAIATLAIAVALEELLFKWQWFTGGILGSEIERPTLWGIDFGVFAVGDAFPRRTFGVLVVVVAGVMFIAVANLRRSITGVRWLAVRSNERAAAAAGINVARTKLTAFAAGGFIAGIGGTLIAYQQPILTTTSFAVLASLTVLAITYLAGIASPNAAILAGVLSIGGLLTVALNQVNDTAADYQFALNGLLLIFAAVMYPSGITGATRNLAARIRTAAAKRATSEPTRESANVS